MLEVVEREREAGVDRLFEHLDQRGIDLLVLDELEHGAPRLQRERAHVEQELARDVDVGGAIADQQVQAELAERAGHHAGRHRLGADRSSFSLSGRYSSSYATTSQPASKIGCRATMTPSWVSGFELAHRAQPGKSAARASSLNELARRLTRPPARQTIGRTAMAREAPRAGVGPPVARVAPKLDIIRNGSTDVNVGRAAQSGSVATRGRPRAAPGWIS